VELWIGPLLYLHTRALVTGSSGRWWPWVLPGVVQSAHYTVCFVVLGDGASKFAFNDAVHELYVVPVETAVGLGLGVAGVVLAWRLTGGAGRAGSGPAARADIALDAGFSSNATFNRVFRQIKAVSPSRWRADAAEKD